MGGFPSRSVIAPLPFPFNSLNAKSEGIAMAPSPAQKEKARQRAAGESERYYRVMRRDLDNVLSLLGINSNVNTNTRLEHQHFIGSDGTNFGLFDDGKLKPEDISQYEYEPIKHMGDHKYKAKYIDDAVKIIEDRWEKKKEQLRKKTSIIMPVKYQ